MSLGLTKSEVVHVAAGGEILTRARLRYQATFAYNAANYWTHTLRRRRDGQSFGELVGSYTTATRTITGLEPVDLAPLLPTKGLKLDRGDELVMTSASTGTPSVPNASVLLDFQRKAR